MQGSTLPAPGLSTQASDPSYFAILKSLHTPTLIINQTWQIQFANQPALNLLRADEAAILNHPLADFMVSPTLEPGLDPIRLNGTGG